MKKYALEIALALITLLSNCAWFVSGQKHKQEIESIKADNRMKDMELAQLYVDQFEQNIADPLRLEVRELREEVKQLKDAIEVISDCPYRDNCPVRDKLRRE